MSSDHSLRLHDDEVLLPALQERARHDPERPVAVLELGALDASSQNVELLAEDEILKREASALGGDRAEEPQ